MRGHKAAPGGVGDTGTQHQGGHPCRLAGDSRPGPRRTQPSGAPTSWLVSHPRI